MKRTLTMILCMLFCTPSLLLAQQMTVTGKVTDQHGHPLAGVTVIVKGTTAGVSSDSDGAYRISGLSSRDVLQFSSIGMVSAEFAVGARTVIDVSLKEDMLALEEVVVVGYGSMKNKDLTAPISTVKGSEIVRHSTPNPLQALQGKVAGVQISNFGEPGSSPGVRIRGVGSFTNESPLYVVDGMFYDNIDFLSNADVQDIAVLKDASAASIYGVRASNGVIIITTKQGQFNQKARISYDGYVGVQTVTNMLDMASSSEYAMMMKERGDTDILQKSIDYWGGDDLVPATDTDWYDQITRNAIIHSHSLDITGGTAKAAYVVGVNYLYQEGIMKAKSDFERINVRTKADYQPWKWLKMGANVIMSHSERNSASNSAWERAYYAPPILPVYDQTNEVTYPEKFTSFDKLDLTNGVYGNPVAMAYYGENRTKTVQVMPSYYLNLDFLSNNKLVFRTSFNQVVSFASTRNFTPEFHVSQAHHSTKSSLTKSNDVWQNYTFDNTLTYQDSFGQHNLTAMIGASVRNEDWRSLFGSGRGLLGTREEYLYLSQAETESLTAGDNGTTYRGASFFGRVSYNYANKYLLTASLRADGSSKYQEKWGYFPSVGAAWVLSEERFMQQQRAIDYLKLRVSYGQLGNDKISASNGFPATLSGLSYSGVFGEVLFPGFRINENFSWLSWETVEEANVGFELGLFRNRLHVDFDYYHRLTRDAVISVPVPTSTDMVPGNWGRILNQGVELTLGWSDSVGKDFSYRIGFNMSTLNNKVKSLKYGVPYVLGGNTQFRTITRPGDPMYSFFGYKVTGVYQNDAEIQADPIAVANGLQPGDLRYEDLNHDNIIDDRDRQILGSALPSFTYGGNIDLAYKGWDLSISFMGVTGNEIVNQKRGSRGTADRMNYEASVVKNRWHGEGTSNSLPSAAGLNRSWNFNTMNSYFVEDGSYFRIQNIQLGYTFRVKNGPSFRVHAAAERPLTVFKYNGFTPEISSGFDMQTYPLAAVYSFGLSITY